MQKIALPTDHDVLCPHFGKCYQFSVYEIKDNKIVSENALIPPPHEPGVLPAWLAENGVTDIIALGMGQRAIGLFNQHKINVFIGVPVKEPRELVLDYLNGMLETSDNTCDH